MLQVQSIEGLATRKPSSKIGKLPVNTLLQLDCAEADTNPQWHHAGKSYLGTGYLIKADRSLATRLSLHIGACI